jgi:hypothetical protein
MNLELETCKHKINQNEKQKDEIITMDKSKRRLRILYAICHPTLRNIDINLLLSAGFEVIPVLVHIQFRGFHRIDPRATDNPLSEINKTWKKETTLDLEEIERIQKIDFYKINDFPFTQHRMGLNQVESRNFSYSGCVTTEEAKLINDNFDVILFESFLNVPAAAFEWYTGVIAFRIFGNEDANFRIWNWYKENLYDKKSQNFLKCRHRYVSLPVFEALNSVESENIISNERCFLPAVSMEDIEILTKGLNWHGKSSKAVCVTNISRLDVSISWQNYYYNLIEHFDSTPIDIYGKNVLDSEFCRQDLRIKGQIEDYTEYLSKYCEYRVFCSVGCIKQHSQYTIFECVTMGIPVLYHEDSAVAAVFKKYYSKETLYSSGMCKNFSEMQKKANNCLVNFSYARSLAEVQKNHFYEGFGRKKALAEAIRFNEVCRKKIEVRPKETDNLTSASSLNSAINVLWLNYSEPVNFSEFEKWETVGFKINPTHSIESINLTSNYKENEFSKKPNLWFLEKVALNLNDNNLYFSEFFTYNSIKLNVLNEEESDFLNSSIKIIYLIDTLPLAINLIRSGYKGVIVHKFTRLSSSENQLMNLLNLCFLRALCFYNRIYFITDDLNVNKSILTKLIVGKKLYQSFSKLYLLLNKNKLSHWHVEASEPKIYYNNTDIISNYLEYKNFIKFFGHYNYVLSTSNDLAQLSARGLVDPQISELSPFLKKGFLELLRSRVFVDINLDKSEAVRSSALLAFAVGIPVVFMKNSILEKELVKMGNNKIDLKNLEGACHSYEAMAVLIEKCLSDIEFAKKISSSQEGLRQIITNHQEIDQKNELLEELKSKTQNSPLLNFQFILFSKFLVYLQKIILFVVKMRSNAKARRLKKLEKLN